MARTSEDPVRSAAVWFVAAFGLLASVLLAGVNVTGSRWTETRHPALVVVVVAAAVGSAVIVIVAAAAVLLPSTTLGQLADIEAEEQQKLQRDRPADRQRVGWHEVATQDARGVLNHLALDCGHEDGPTQLRSAFRNGQQVGDKVTALVADADAWYTARAFVRLRTITLFAAAIVIVGVLAWQPLNAPAKTASADEPIPVEVTLRRAGDVIAPGCSARQLAGLAIAGALDRSPLVAFPPQHDCPAAIVTVTSDLGWVKTK